MVGEALMLGLRLNEGVDLEEMSDRYECDLETVFSAEFRRSLDLGLLERAQSRRLRLTRRGLLLSNNVFCDLV